MELFSLRIDQETMDELSRVAKALERSRNWVIRDALHAYVEEQKQIEEKVSLSRAQFENGDAVSHEHVMDEMQRIIDESADA